MIKIFSKAVFFILFYFRCTSLDIEQYDGFTPLKQFTSEKTLVEHQIFPWHPRVPRHQGVDFINIRFDLFREHRMRSFFFGAKIGQIGDSVWQI